MNGGSETPAAEPALPYVDDITRQRRMRLLLLGGTSEAKSIAYALSRESYVIMTVSLARADRIPHDYGAPVRIGGWGGEDAYRAWLVREQITTVIDATHPFANQMGHRTARLVKELGIDAIRFMRQPWLPGKKDAWTFLNRPEEAARHIPEKATVFLATGRRDLDQFANLSPRRVLCRVRDTPKTEMPFANGHFQVTHGPVTVDDEIDLFDEQKVDWIVTRNSGGQGGWPKLEAARALGIPVALIRRPPPADLLRINTVTETLNWVRRRK